MAITGINNSSYTSYYASNYKNTVKKTDSEKDSTNTKDGNVDVYKRQAYLKAKEKYDMQREKLAGRYKTKTAMYEASVSYTHLDVYKRQP